MKGDSSDIIYGSILAALSSIDDGVIIVSDDRRVEYMNKAAEKIFSPAQRNGEDLTFIEVVRDYECDALLRRCMETGDEQTELIRARQNNRLLNITIMPDKDNIHYMAVIKDLTERQHLENVRRDLITNISHEFRTPIASIKLLSETLIDGANRDQAISLDFLKKIEIEADKLTQMADDLRELAAIESKGSVLSKVTTDMERMIKQVILRLEAQARRKQIVLVTVIDAGLPRLVIDKDRVESVLVNLIHNAIKFTEPGGKITIGAGVENNDILVKVTDTGTGISADELPRIFERFYKVDKSRWTEGSGLGLAISKHVISAHGGRIWAESEEGKGSTFYFTLPLNL